MDAFPHFITSGLCLLNLDLGQKGLQKSLGAFSAISGAWPLSRVRVGHVVASFGVLLVTRSRRSRVRVVCDLLKSRGRVSHAVASLPLRFWHAIASSMRSRGCQFLKSSVSHFPSIFVCFLFHPLSHSALENLKLLNTLITASNGNKGN